MESEKMIKLVFHKLEMLLMKKVQRYNPDKYWKYRTIVVNKNNKTCKIKKMDAFNNASFGTQLNYGAKFKTIPNLPHGLRGIFISQNAEVGKNATIFQHVTIGRGNNGAPKIGDNCYIGVGAKIIGNINIGNNVKIGAGCVVATNIPDNCTVVMQKPRIIKK